MSIKDIDSLKCAIDDAFISVAKPNAGQIAEWSDWDKECIDRDFLGLLNGSFKSDDILPVHAKSLPALAPRAFIFFLRDYLNYAIENPDSELAEHLIYRFSELDPLDEYWIPRLDLMTSDIFSIIIDCLSFVRRYLPESNQYLANVAKKSIDNLNHAKLARNAD